MRMPMPLVYIAIPQDVPRMHRLAMVYESTIASVRDGADKITWDDPAAMMRAFTIGAKVLGL